MLTTADLEDPVPLERLYRVGLALTAERDRDRLLELILGEAKALCRADGGTLYLNQDGERLRFAIVQTTSLELWAGGSTGRAVRFPPIPLCHGDRPNLKNIASACLHHRKTINVDDVYHSSDFDFAGTRAFDRANGYRSQSVLAVPLLARDGEVLGVLQLLNAMDAEGQKIVTFGNKDVCLAEALASQAAIALENQALIDGQQALIESFIKLIAQAIDDKSPYTGGHCRRVPKITEMLAQAACDAKEGPFADFSLSDAEWYELKIASWLHDCGKITTPVHVMDKATKLEAIHDRIELVALRYEVMKREVELAELRSQADELSPATVDALRALDADLEFLRRTNVGGEFVRTEDLERLARIAETPYPGPEGSQRLLSTEELAALSVRRGTLTDAERLIINGHMVQTIQMLEALPFPPHLARVPEYACHHHEKMDGKGYPRGVFAGDLPVPARILAIADVFEALTAQDRPYKEGKRLSETMRIMGFMKRENHLDPDLFDLFVRSGVYRAYAKMYLPPALIDEVDERALLDVVPESVALPPAEERAQRRGALLPEYDALRTQIGAILEG